MHAGLLFTILVLLLSSSIESRKTKDVVIKSDRDYKFVCYVGTWSNYWPGDGRFTIEDIDPQVCTHVIYGFAKIENDKITEFDSWLDMDDGLGGYKRFNGLRQQNPNLKTLIAIGGWNEGSEKYSAMASDPARRSVFVQSVVAFLDKYGFSGLDFDWEYPAARGGKETDKENFVLCLKELRAALEPKGYLLTAAVSVGRATIDVAYDIPNINKYLDQIHLMAYDMFGAWDNITGHNAPLFRKNDNDALEVIHNVEYGLNYWLDQGASANKIVLGMPLYGRTFTLKDPAVNGLRVPVTGSGGKAGPYTRQDGILGYKEICVQVQQNPSAWTRIFDRFVQAPYIVNGNQWIGYDDPESLKLKVQYAKCKGIAGAMVWSMETDDHKGLCGTKNILLETIKAELENGVVPPCPERPASDSPDPPTPKPDPTPKPTQAPPTTPKPEVFECKEAGLFPYPAECAKYIECIANGNTFIRYDRSCASGTHWNNKSKACDFPANAECPWTKARKNSRKGTKERNNIQDTKYEWRKVKIGKHYKE